MVACEMSGKKAYETNENLLSTLWHKPSRYGLGLCVLHVEEKDGVEHLEDFGPIDVVGMNVTHYLTHLFCQPLRIVVGECKFWLV